jgi:cytochrome P450
MTTATVDDLLGTEATQDPYAYFGPLREHDPLHWSERYRAWILTRHADLAWLTRQHGLFSSAVAANDPERTYPSLSPLDPELRDALGRIYLEAFQQHDRPEHLAMRQAIHRSFTPAAIEAWRPEIRDIVAQLLAPRLGDGRMEVRADLATPLALIVICRMLGLPASDGPLMRRLTEAVTGGPKTVPDGGRAVIDGLRELEDYLEPIIEARRRKPGDDLISLLVDAERRGAYTRRQLFANVVLLLTAGHETTINLVCNGILAFARHPHQWRIVRRDPAGVCSSATEECLRYDPPLKMLWRVCAADVERDGTLLRAGDRVFWVIAAANRDPAAFVDPDRFDVLRATNQHLAFGGGIHHCLGAALARVEGQEAFRAMAEAFPEFELETDPVEYVPDWQIRRMRALSVTWT